MFNKLKERLRLLEDGETTDLGIMKGMSDRILTLEKYNEHHTHRCNVHDGLIGKVENDLDKLRDDVRLIMKYLGVHKEIINETCLIDDECCCDECHLDEVEEKLFEDVKPEPKKKK